MPGILDTAKACFERDRIAYRKVQDNAVTAVSWYKGRLYEGCVLEAAEGLATVGFLWLYGFGQVLLDERKTMASVITALNNTGIGKLVLHDDGRVELLVDLPGSYDEPSFCYVWQRALGRTEHIEKCVTAVKLGMSDEQVMRIADEERVVRTRLERDIKGILKDTEQQ